VTAVQVVEPKATAAGGPFRRVRRRPIALAAVGLVAVDAAIALAGGRVPALDVAVLLLAPGMAFLPLLPERVRAHRLATFAALPTLGMALSMVVLVTTSKLGVPIDGTWVRVIEGVVVLVGLLAFTTPDLEGESPHWWELAGLAAAIVAGAWLGGRAIAGFPVPGNDWAKYVLYADEIRRQHALLIDNPFWMLGVPFREDPGVPALYGSFLTMAGGPAITVVHGIWILSGFCTAALYAYVRAFWGAAAGVIAAALFAVMPIEQDILGWHGAPTVAAIALMTIGLISLTSLLVQRLTWRETTGFGLVLLALAAAHRLTFVVTVGAFGAVLVIALIAFRVDRRRILTGLGQTAIAVVVLGGGVIADLIVREQSFGGTQDYKAYLGSKLNLYYLARDLTYAAAIVGVLALVYLLVSKRLRTRLVLPIFCLFAVVLAGTFAWVVHVPNSYLRMAYYAPVPLAAATAIVFACSPLRLRRFALAAAAVLIAATTVIAWDQANVVRLFYGFTDPGSLRALDLVSHSLKPNEVVVTDRCWSFQVAWLLHTRTLAALDPADIQPKAELPRAREAASILAGLPEGRAAARRLGVRYLIVNPTCRSVSGERKSPPLVGRPVYAGFRLAVFQLAPDRPGA
jgi:hypothetical protein